MIKIDKKYIKSRKNIIINIKHKKKNIIHSLVNNINKINKISNMNITHNIRNINKKYIKNQNKIKNCKNN